jgi:ribA/ribD-fused uncharacterized protein
MAMVCAMALGVGFLVLKVTNEYDNRHQLVQAGNPNGKFFGLVYNYSGPHWSATVAEDGKGDKEAVYFLHQHPFASSHEAPFQCANEAIPCTRGVYFTTVVQCFAYLKAMHANDMANGNHPHFTDVAARILQTTSTAVVANMSAQMGRHEDFDAASWGAARQEDMLVALRAKFDSYPDLTDKLRDSAGCPLAQASQGDCDHGIGLDVVYAKSGMAWRGQNLFGKCLELLREELLAATAKGIAKTKRRQRRGHRRKAEAGKQAGGGQQLAPGKKQREIPRNCKDEAAKPAAKRQRKQPEDNGACVEVAFAGADVELGGTAPAGTKCNVCQRGAVRGRWLVMCGCCSKWVHAEFNVCDKPSHQGRQMCSKGSVVIECALCSPEPAGKVLPEAANEEPAGDSFLEHWLGYNSTGLKDGQLLEGQVLHYNGDRADILAARGTQSWQQQRLQWGRQGLSGQGEPAPFHRMPLRPQT